MFSFSPPLIGMRAVGVGTVVRRVVDIIDIDGWTMGRWWEGGLLVWKGGEVVGGGHWGPVHTCSS